MIKKAIRYLKNLQRQNDELLWAKTWDDTKRGIDWAENLPSLSPGRWAVGYNYLYIITRILDTIEPHSILDLGLGISSTLFSAYFTAKGFPDAKHTIIEQNKEWAEFYIKRNELSCSSKIRFADCIKMNYKGETIFAYRDFQEMMKGESYSLISIDAPWGSDRYSRRDIVDLIPAILKKNFIIVMDDAERIGEKDTINEIQKRLTDNGIAYCVGNYSGQTDCCIICTDEYKFLCTL